MLTCTDLGINPCTWFATKLIPSDDDDDDEKADDTANATAAAEVSSSVLSLSSSASPTVFISLISFIHPHHLSSTR